MNILTVCNIDIPILMITIGILYRHNLYKGIDKILGLIMPIAMTFNGFSDDRTVSCYKDRNMVASANRKCSLIWSTSGITILLFTIILVMLNKSNVYNIRIKLLELECLILAFVFITIEYIFKKSF
ncbi:hypothetical protein FDF74_08480 [Clostridium niameyense]|uniref:Uncharacterized protein n=1 Tax=Clostridium niameyense TaxID=1622073 RepID=A0A6M0RCA1_9CLOT|nr:hypothetical protein [Clostridium niameyense]NEZ47239.1 hypothetical protein [Clostridium niameyense]